MKSLAVLLAGVAIATGSPALAQDFTTETAKAARAAYEADLQAAREKYAAALDEAAKQAVEAGELDEVVRIKEAKDELAGTKPTAKVKRRLWIKAGDKGFFEQLHTGHWVERLSSDASEIHFESNRTDEYIELTPTRASTTTVRLYADRLEARLEKAKPYRRLVGGHWKE